ncbi:MAG: YbjQ family protein [Bacillota bacterium]
MLMTNTEEIAGKKVARTYGLVKGSTIRAKHVGKDIVAALRTLVGGEIKEYTEMLEDARNISLLRMSKEAEAMGANAIVNIRFATSQVMTGAAELLVYGTAVWVEDE